MPRKRKAASSWKQVPVTEEARILGLALKGLRVMAGMSQGQVALPLGFEGASRVSARESGRIELRPSEVDEHLAALGLDRSILPMAIGLATRVSAMHRRSRDLAAERQGRPQPAPPGSDFPFPPALVSANLEGLRSSGHQVIDHFADLVLALGAEWPQGSGPTSSGPAAPSQGTAPQGSGAPAGEPRSSFPETPAVR